MTKKAWLHLKRIEGGFSNDKFDAGGATKYGVTIGTLRRWRKAKTTIQHVKDLTESEAVKIFSAKYWDAWKLDEVKNSKVQIVLMSQAVNWGVGKATQRKVQRSLKKLGFKLTIDGDIGPITRIMLNKVNARLFIWQYICDAQDYYIKLAKRKPTQMKLLAGWINRTQKSLRLLV